MKTKTLVLILLLLASSGTWGQNDKNVWFFGGAAGIDFNPVVPQPITGMSYSFEGTSSICDPTGILLFYTDGVRVWNRNHQVMTNGGGLQGLTSSAQSALIVPRPGACGQYYIFTTRDHTTSDHSMTYSLVDMNLSGGLGAVVAGQKNILIHSSISEKLAAAPHADGQSYWILTHTQGGNSYLAYHLTNSGLNLTPVTSNVGATYASNCGEGMLVFNHSFTKIAYTTLWSCEDLVVSNFNNATGMVSNSTSLSSFPLGNPYGVEFSPNDQILYVTDAYAQCYLRQVDMNNYSNTFDLATDPTNYGLGALAEGPDGRIYVAKNGPASLGVVQNPNVWGAGANYVSNGLGLAPGSTSTLGLPSFPRAYLPTGPINGQSPPFTYSDTCYGLPTQFLFSGPYDSLSWNFGDLSTGQLNFSALNNPAHTFSSPGVFTVFLIVHHPCGVDTLADTITIAPNSPFDLGPDSSFCAFASPINLLGPANGSSYLWSTGDTTPAIQVSTFGTYWLEVNTCLGVERDSISLIFSDTVNVDFLGDTVVCNGTPVSIVGPAGFMTYLWSTGASSNTITVSNPGVVTMIVSDTAGCSYVDTLNVLSQELPIVELGNDTTFCLGDSLVLTASIQNSQNLLWSNGSTSATVVIQNPGVLFITASNECGISVDSITVQTNGAIIAFIVGDTLVCSTTDSVPLFINHSSGNVIWSTGETTDSIFVPGAGVYFCSVFDSLGCELGDTIVIQETPPPSDQLPQDLAICAGHPAEIGIDPAFTDIQWNTGDTTRMILVEESGTYIVQAAHICGNLIDTIRVTTDGSGGNLFIPNVFTPNGDGLNETFSPHGYADGYALQIFDRWGKLLYESTDISIGWNGKLHGKDVAEGVYVAVVYYVGCSGIQDWIIHSVTLLR